MHSVVIEDIVRAIYKPLCAETIRYIVEEESL